MFLRVDFEQQLLQCVVGVDVNLRCGGIDLCTRFFVYQSAFAKVRSPRLVTKARSPRHVPDRTVLNRDTLQQFIVQKVFT